MLTIWTGYKLPAIHHQSLCSACSSSCLFMAVGIKHLLVRSVGQEDGTPHYYIILYYVQILGTQILSCVELTLEFTKICVVF